MFAAHAATARHRCYLSVTPITVCPHSHPNPTAPLAITEFALLSWHQPLISGDLVTCYGQKSSDTKREKMLWPLSSAPKSWIDLLIKFQESWL